MLIYTVRKLSFYKADLKKKKKGAVINPIKIF